MLVYGSYLYRGGKSGCKMVTLFDSYSCDGVSAGIWVIHTGAKSGGSELVKVKDFFLMLAASDLSYLLKRTLLLLWACMPVCCLVFVRIHKTSSYKLLSYFRF